MAVKGMNMSSANPYIPPKSFDPDVVLVKPCGFGLEQTLAERRLIADSLPWACSSRIADSSRSALITDDHDLDFGAPDRQPDVPDPLARPPRTR